MSDAVYRKWPLSHRRSRPLPSRFDPDDLLRRPPQELVEMITRRQQELWVHPIGVGQPPPSPGRLVRDLSLVVLTLLRLIDARQERSR